jgi:L-ascorbate metabolism protein UlaG (beta-lactamase superfamily)
MKKLTIIFSLLLFSLTVSAQLEIRYIGNMGVLISGEESSVLIDGLHTEYNKEYYLFPPQSLVDSLTNSIGGFPRVKVIATTHYHGDHFDAQQVNAFLSKNNWSLFFGSEQSTELLSKIDSTKKNQIITINTNTYQKQTVNAGNISITGFYLNHVNPARHGSVQNVGFVIEIDGKKILHTGDSNWFEKAFTELKLEDENIDVAIFPFWMLLDNKDSSKLKKWINPKYIVATHLPPTGYEDYIKTIKTTYPKTTFLITLNQKVEIQN